MIRMTPLRRTTRQLLQIRLTLALTFMKRYPILFLS
jgi:hypothetical protein